MRLTPLQTGSAIFGVALAAIFAALLFEHIGGYVPCPLCLQQRYAYYFGVPAAALGLILIRNDSTTAAAAALFAAVALAFLVNAGLGVYQAGAEWGAWPGPDACAGAQGVATNAGDLLKGLRDTRVVRCDEASWRLAGLSFAGWNAVISATLALAGGWLAVRLIRK